jgi:DNA-binding response OmpR family regulator
MTSTGNHPPVGQLQGAGRAESSVTTGKPRILIVEDQMPVAMMMTFLLARAGCETAVATTGKKAVQMAEEVRFDLITLDVDLPDGNGFILCNRLKEHPRLRDTPIVFVSGRSCIEDQQHGLDVGAADYITKPFETFEFAPRLLSHVRQAKEFSC